MNSDNVLAVSLFSLRVIRRRKHAGHFAKMDWFGSFWFYCMSSIVGSRGVMATVVGNGHGDTSSNPGRD